MGADDVIAEMEKLTEMVGLAQQRWRFALLETGRLLLAGHADEAETANERTLEIGNEGIPEALGAFGGVLYAVRQHQGRLDEIAELLIDVARDNPSIAALRSAIPSMLGELGRIDKARDRLSVEADTGFDFPYEGTWMAAMCNLTDAAATTGHLAAANALVERLAPFAGHVIAPSGVLVQGAAARPLARAATVLGDYDQAEQWFGSAHDIHNRLRAPYWAALGQLDHADLCLARRAGGDLDRARDLISTAAATATEYGCAGLTKRAEAVLTKL